MKGIELEARKEAEERLQGSDHCPAMKGIEPMSTRDSARSAEAGSDHCPAMKGIELLAPPPCGERGTQEATTAPQ